jgi:hypothetical protein
MTKYLVKFQTKKGDILPVTKTLTYDDSGDLIATTVEGLANLDSMGETVIARPYIAGLAPDKITGLKLLDPRQILVSKIDEAWDNLLKETPNADSQNQTGANIQS